MKWCRHVLVLGVFSYVIEKQYWLHNSNFPFQRCFTHLHVGFCDQKERAASLLHLDTAKQERTEKLRCGN